MYNDKIDKKHPKSLKILQKGNFILHSFQTLFIHFQIFYNISYDISILHVDRNLTFEHYLSLPEVATKPRMLPSGKCRFFYKADKEVFESRLF